MLRAAIDQTGQSSPRFTSEVGREQRRIQITGVARDSYIPVIYGGWERTGGLLYTAAVNSSGNLVLAIILCEGPIEEIGTVEMNDLTLPAGVTITKYTGTQTTVDATLAAAVSGFNETLNGIAYMVAVVPPGVSTGFPRFTALVKGRKVYDPRENLIYPSNYGTGWADPFGRATITTGISDPFGGTAAVRFKNTTGLTSVLRINAFGTVALGAQAYTLSFYCRQNVAPTSVAADVGDGQPSADYTAQLSAGNWVRVVISGTSTSRNVTFVDLISDNTQNFSLDFYGVQLNTGVTALPLTPTTTAAVTPQAAVFSDNPALILADFLSDSSYGARKLGPSGYGVDISSIIEAANFCDELVGSPPEKRNTLTISIPQKRPIMDWIDTLRAYVPCWVSDDGVTATLIVDKPRSSDHTFTAASIDRSPPPKLKKRGVMDSPNAVEVAWTRTDLKPWATGYAEASTGATRVRKAQVDLPGIRRYSQARRFAIERLNHYTLEDLEIELGVFEDGLKVREGDVITVTDDIGVSAKQFRVLEATDRGFGRWTLKGREYDQAAYSSVVETTPTTPNTNLPDPKVVPAATGLSITEQVYLEKVVSADSLSRGFIYQSRFRISWTASTYTYPKTYRVQILDGASIIYEGSTADTNHTSPPIQQNKLYTIRVYTRGDLGFESAYVETTATAVGKNLPPGDVPAINSALEIGGEVLLAWTPAIDVDIVRYEWRYMSTAGYSWDSATLIDRVDGLRARFRGLPVGTWRFAVKAIDSVGQYSANAATADVTITADASAFLQDREFTSPTLTNMAELPQLEGQAASSWKKRWATRVSSDAWNSAMPNPVNSGGNPVISYHASATSKFQGESWDLGVLVTGDWAIVADVTALTGSVTYEIETSSDGSSWTTQTAGLTWKGIARYVRPVIRCATTSTIQINQPPKMTLISSAKREANTTSSLASGPKTVTLVNKYLKVIRVLVTPIGTTSKTATVDNIIVSLSGSNSFDVYIFNSSGTQIVSDFYWEFEGI